jgi:hypothetical protein
MENEVRKRGKTEKTKATRKISEAALGTPRKRCEKLGSFS